MALLRELYKKMTELNVVNSQGDFSNLWGKGDSWYSTSLARDRQPGLDALVRFYVRLNDIEKETRDAACSSTDPEIAASYAAGAQLISKINGKIWDEITYIARENV